MAKKAAKTIPKSTRFEDALAELEEIVEKLEGGEQSLDESLGQFERGISLARFCQQSLSDADSKVKILMESGAQALDAESSTGDDIPLQDFDGEDD